MAIDVKSAAFWLTAMAAPIILISLLLFGRYGSFRRSPLAVTLVCLLGYFLSFYVVVIIPVDVSQSLHSPCDPTFEFCPTEDFLITFWNITYWITFSLCWFFIPLLQSYTEAGDFHFTAKLRSSLRVNAYFYLIAGGFFGVLLIYLAFSKGVHKLSDVYRLGIATANTWGLFILITMLGYGLIEVPRYWWLNSNYELMYKYSAFQCVQLEMEVKTAAKELLTAIKAVEVAAQSVPYSDKLREYVDVVVSKCPVTFQDHVLQSNPVGAAATTGDTTTGSVRSGGIMSAFTLGAKWRTTTDKPITYDDLASLHRKLLHATTRYEQQQSVYAATVEQAFELEDILENEQSLIHIFRSSIRRPRQGCFGTLVDRLQWWWCVKFAPRVYQLVAILLGVLSAALIWSEITIFVPTTLPLSPFSWPIPPTKGNIFLLQLTILVPVLYACYCTYFSLFRVKIWNLYKLIPNSHTSAFSLLFSAAYLCRLNTPLLLNYLGMVRVKGTAFQSVIGDMDVLPFLGTSFLLYFPVFLGLLCLATYTNAWTTLLTTFRIRRFSFQESFNHHQIDLGRELLDKERQSRENALLRDEVRGGSGNRGSGGSSGSSGGSTPTTSPSAAEEGRLGPNVLPSTTPPALDKTRAESISGFSRLPGVSAPVYAAATAGRRSGEYPRASATLDAIDALTTPSPFGPIPGGTLPSSGNGSNATENLLLSDEHARLGRGFSKN